MKMKKNATGCWDTSSSQPNIHAVQSILRHTFAHAGIQIYDECTEDAVRDSTGACSSSKDICSSQCGPAGGSFSSISGLCSCAGEKSLDEVCDEACRATRPQLILKESKLLIDDPETASGDREFALQDLTTQTGLATGSYECEDKAGCTIRMFDTTLGQRLRTKSKIDFITLVHLS